jgi:hypothetical protein
VAVATQACNGSRHHHNMRRLQLSGPPDRSTADRSKEACNVRVSRQHHGADFKARVAITGPVAGERSTRAFVGIRRSSDNDQHLEAALMKRASKLFAHGNKAPTADAHIVFLRLFGLVQCVQSSYRR